MGGAAAVTVQPGLGCADTSRGSSPRRLGKESLGARRDEEWAPPVNSDDGGRRRVPDRRQLDLPPRSLVLSRNTTGAPPFGGVERPCRWVDLGSASAPPSAAASAGLGRPCEWCRISYRGIQAHRLEVLDQDWKQHDSSSSARLLRRRPRHCWSGAEDARGIERLVSVGSGYSPGVVVPHRAVGPPKKGMRVGRYRARGRR